MTWEAFVLERIRDGSLIKLVSSNELIFEENVKELAAALKRPDCKVWHLTMMNAESSMGGLLAMVAALQVAPILHLGIGLLDDEGLAVLTLALGSSRCRVMSLSAAINARSNKGHGSARRGA